MRPFRRTVLCAAALAGLLAGGPVQATTAGACLTPEEFQAEQAIRLHTELMVISLTCQQAIPAGSPNLFDQYKQFTSRHQARIRTWEQALVAHFKRQGKGNAVRRLDSFRTRLANEASQRAIALTAPVFCANHVPLVAAALEMDEAALVRVVQGEGAVQVASVPRCDRPRQDQLVADATPR